MSENRKAFLFFQGVGKGCIGNKWVNTIKQKHFVRLKEVVCRFFFQNRSSWKSWRFHWKTPALESLFNKVAALRACGFIKKIPQHSCFPVKFEKFLNTFYYRIPSVDASVRLFKSFQIWFVPFNSSGFFLYTLKTWIFWCFHEGSRKIPVARNGSIYYKQSGQPITKETTWKLSTKSFLK